MRLVTITKLPLLLLLCFFATCGSCTPEKKIKTLSFFFDGVVKESQTTENNRLLNENRKTTKSQMVEEKREGRKVVSFHKPYREGKCERCHNTKASNTLTDKKKDLCFKCHKESDFTGKYVHGPVAAGKCLTCHLPHESSNKALLVSVKKDLCFACHNEQDIVKIKKHLGYEDCLKCHLPHVGDNNYFLKSDNSKL